MDFDCHAGRWPDLGGVVDDDEPVYSCCSQRNIDVGHENVAPGQDGEYVVGRRSWQARELAASISSSHLRVLPYFPFGTPRRLS